MQICFSLLPWLWGLIHIKVSIYSQTLGLEQALLKCAVPTLTASQTFNTEAKLDLFYFNIHLILVAVNYKGVWWWDAWISLHTRCELKSFSQSITSLKVVLTPVVEIIVVSNSHPLHTHIFQEKKDPFWKRCAFVVFSLTVLNSFYGVCWLQRHMKATAHTGWRKHPTPISFNLPKPLHSFSTCVAWWLLSQIVNSWKYLHFTLPWC